MDLETAKTSLLAVLSKIGEGLGAREAIAHFVAMVGAGVAAEALLVSAEELGPFCQQLAARITANAPLATRYTLEAVRRGVEMPLHSGLSLESALFGTACATEDMREGVQAFVEKRAARFRGR